MMIRFPKLQVNEFIFVIYLYLFSLLKIFTINLQSLSTPLLILCVLVLSLISIFYNRDRLKRESIVLLLIFFIIFVLDLLIRNNSFSILYIIDFVIYGCVTIFLYSNVDNKKILLKYYSLISIVMFLIYFLDPINEYAFTTNYMIFGFNFMLPIFAGLYIGYRYLKYTWMSIPLLIVLIELLVFANKGAFLAALSIILIFSWIDSETKSIKKITTKRFFLLSLLAILAFTAWQYLIQIIDYIISITVMLGISSYSLVTFQNILRTNNLIDNFSVREDIWKSAYDFFRESPLLGNGIGSFHANYGIYPHNFLLEIITSFGIVGLIVFISILLVSTVKIFTDSSYDRIFGLMVLCLWFVPLTFSMSMFESKEIWLYLAMGILHKRQTSRSL